MKYLLLLISIVTINLSFSTNPNSKIENVTVYLNGAQIKRIANIKLPVGTTELKFDRLSPYIQEESIQISGLKNASILSINYGINYISKQSQTQEIETLNNQIKLVYDKIQFEDDLIAGYNEELLIIQNNRNLGNESQSVSLEKLQQFSKYYRTRITEIKTLIYKSEKNKNNFRVELSDIQKQLHELNANDKVQTGEIILKLSSSTTMELNLSITYNVTNAGWFPIYDIKANKINTPLELVYKAHIYQNTGDDWDNVKLTLSTNNPNTNNIKPELNTHYLNFINKYNNYSTQNTTKRYQYTYNPMVKMVSGIVTDASGAPLPGVNVIEKGTTNGVQTDFDGKYTLKITSGSELVYSYIGMKADELPIHSSVMNVALSEDTMNLEEVVVVAYGTRVKSSTSFVKEEEIKQDINIVEEGITNLRFQIAKPYSISSDGDVTVIEIESYSVPANYNYFSAPLLNENVFLTADIRNWEMYNLIPAEANVYFEGSYSGKTFINPRATTDSLNISLGVDPNIVVKRTQLNDFKKNTFIGNNKVVYKGFEIELKNSKSSAVDITLLDRIPISQNKEIKVDDIDFGTSNYDDKKGLMEWKVTLKPSETKSYKFSYAIKFPKNQRVNL